MLSFSEHQEAMCDESSCKHIYFFAVSNIPILASQCGLESSSSNPHTMNTNLFDLSLIARQDTANSDL